MSAMQAGTQMVKLRGSSKGLVRFYFLDEHRSCIRWRPSRKNEKAKSEWVGPSDWGVAGDPPHARMRRPRMSGAVLEQETLPEQPPGSGRGSKTLSPESPQAWNTGSAGLGEPWWPLDAVGEGGPQPCCPPSRSSGTPWRLGGTHAQPCAGCWEGLRGKRTFGLAPWAL